MFRSTQLLRWVLLCALVLSPAVAAAQMESALYGMGSDHGISGVGTASVQERPTSMRMSVQLSEKAETLKEALTRLKDRRAAAVLQLEALGAKEDAIIVQPPELSTGTTRQQQRMEQVLRMRRMQGRRVPKGLELPKIVTVTSLLTAEWPLDMQTAEDVLAFAKDLEDKVTEADLAGTKDRTDLSPEAEELDEEMQMMMESMSYSEEEVAPGEPHFYFVAKLSEAAREKAMAEAFARAKSNAEQLAQAAGIELGPLVSLKGYLNQTSGRDVGNYYGESSYRMRMMLARQTEQTGDGDPRMEALVASPNTANFQIVVMAAFSLK